MNYDTLFLKQTIFDLQMARLNLQYLVDMGYPLIDILFYVNKEIEERDRRFEDVVRKTEQKIKELQERE